ncbi:MAG: helix-turn-helix domain-containing protein [Planctomycetia bacterium]
MRLGGHLTLQDQRLEAVLTSANDGLTPFPKSRWVPSRWPGWVIDTIHSDQRQRIERGEPFTRKAGTVALYRPKLRYLEWQTKGQSQYESWVIFSLAGRLEQAFLDLTADGGYCHLLDPDQLVAHHLAQVSHHVYYRRAGHALRAQAAFLDLIALVVTSQPVEPRLRLVREYSTKTDADSLVEQVDRFIRAHIDEPLRVAQLAAHVGLSVSVFAHAYSSLAGETPHRTIVRVKIETAKKLMVNERFTVREVARRLGYSSEFQLSRSFKRVEGVSPTAYLKTMTSKQRP